MLATEDASTWSHRYYNARWLDDDRYDDDDDDEGDDDEMKTRINPGNTKDGFLTPSVFPIFPGNRGNIIQTEIVISQRF